MNRALPVFLLLLAGCAGDAPTGQVVARVDGVEVTRRELIEELKAGQEDNVAQQAAALERVIDRKLLVAAAKAALVDRTPTVQITQRREAEGVLAQAYLAQVDAGVDEPGADAVTRYAVDHPWRYARRFGALLVQEGAGGAPLVVDSAVLRSADAAQMAGTERRAVLTLEAHRYRLVDRWSMAFPAAAQQAQARADLLAERQMVRRQAVLAHLRRGAVIERQAVTPD